ncbi:uncharacterized protein LOC120634993 [Pararge aegeria]|uniref:uncharacterized protein LOC120634993 n=1 Tax=Pararge aegeria TaxID=116150 RepID=UPI0019D132EA|nr:uncharacterized protein LOC120634993 [Pararge aegeria]
MEGLLVANCIVKVKPNSRVNISVVNTSESTVHVDSNLKFQILPLEQTNHQEVFYSIDHNISRSTLTRTEEVLNLLRIGHLTSEEANALYELCSTYSDIFHLSDDKLTCTEALEHEITTSSSVPINTKSYRFPEIHKQEVQSQINKMLDNGIIKPSTSPWSSPIWIVPKKLDASGQRKWRVVIDYRKLNDITIGDSYPIPNISEILDQLGKCKYFSTLDLASGFHQIKIAERDAPKSAFSVPQGHFEFTRMPFGLKNAPATFQRLMNTALSGLQGIQCFVYLDDIVIYSYDLDTHMRNLSNIFDRLRKFHLKLQPDKCEFLRREVSYLGHIITDEGVKPNPEKTRAVEEFPIPKRPKDIKSFLGLVSYYRRFIPNLSKIAKPLTTLLKKDISFVWGNEHQLAFEHLKNALISAPILAYPDFTKPFLLTCDASNFAISAILSQGSVGNDRPIAYASRTLNKAECNYSVTEKECLAIIFGTKTFRPYLYGHKFTIVTDHRPLKWLFNCKEPGSKLVRWRLKLEEFDYEVMYKKGKINSNADTLSRYPVNPIIEENSDPQPSTSGFPNDHPTLETETPADILDDLIDLGDLNISPLQNPNIDFSPLNLPSPSDPLVLPGDIPPNPVSPPEIPTVIEKETSEIPTQSNSPTHSNRDYSEFLKSSTKPNETCNTYIKEHNESLLKSTVKTIIIPTSIDYDESNPYVQDIIASTGDFFLNDERELHSFKKIDANRKTYYFLFTKVYYFDTSTYPDIFKALKSVRDDIMLTGDINEIAIHDFKNPFEQNSFCRENSGLDNIKYQNILQPLDSLFKDILRDFDSISHIISNGISKRSAWFAGVGVVFKHIFGTMNEDDAKHYNEAIKTLYDNDKIITNSVKKSIIVSQIAMSNMNQSLQEMNLNQAKLSDAIDRMSIAVNNVSQAIQLDNFKTNLNSILNILQSSLLTLSFKVEDILNSILFVKANILHPSVLTPNQLYREILTNLKVVPKYRDFPISLDLSNIHVLLNIADLVCYYLDNNTMKYLGLVLDSRWTFEEHFRRLLPKLVGAAGALSRLLPNLGGPSSRCRRLYTGVVRSMALYGAPVWSDTLTALTRALLRKPQRVMASRFTFNSTLKVNLDRVN